MPQKGVRGPGWGEVAVTCPGTESWKEDQGGPPQDSEQGVRGTTGWAQGGAKESDAKEGAAETRREQT